MNHLNYESNPCTDKLSDIEYLKHMIPHHQVAIDMSQLLTHKSHNPAMIYICRDITRKQSYEIVEMTVMKNQLSDNMFGNKISDPNSNDKLMASNVSNMSGSINALDMYYPVMSKSKDGNCNPLFFKPNDHNKMMKHMKITDKSYLEHMIPHHQVAIDMSKRLLLHTNHSYLMVFCKKLIIDQQYEIYLMNNLLTNKYNYKSDLFKN